MSNPYYTALFAFFAFSRHNLFVKASARIDNRAENSHQPTRERERRMRGFRDPECTQAFLPGFGLIPQHFALKRHLLGASLYRKQLTTRFAIWHRFTASTQNPAAFWASAVPLRHCDAGN